MMANSETDTTISSERVIRDRHKLVICAEVVKQVVQSKNAAQTFFTNGVFLLRH